MRMRCIVSCGLFGSNFFFPMPPHVPYGHRGLPSRLWPKCDRLLRLTGRRGRRRRKLLDDLKERRGYSHLKDEALDRTMWRAGFGRGFGPVVRQTAKWMNEYWLTYKIYLTRHRFHWLKDTKVAEKLAICIYSVCGNKLSLDYLYQSWRIFGTRVPNGKPKNFLGTRHSFLSQFLVYFLCPSGASKLGRICVYIHTYLTA
jgi:hypothetical protein